MNPTLTGCLSDSEYGTENYVFYKTHDNHADSLIDRSV